MSSGDQHGSAAPAMRATIVSSTPVPIDVSDGLDGPLDDAAVADAIEGLPAEARGEGPTVDVLDALALGRTRRTARTYQHRLHQFVAWCATRGLRSFPAHPETLRVYFGALAHDRRWSTLHVARAAIVAAHTALGYEDPTSPHLRATLRHLRFTLARLAAMSLAPTALLEILAKCSGDPLAVRDRALILALHFGRLSPRVVSALNREHLVRRESSFLVKLPSARSARGAALEPLELWCHPTVALCPVSALDAWLTERAACVHAPEASPARGALFVTLQGGRGYPLVGGARLGPRGVSRILQRRAISAGLGPSRLTASTFRAHAPLLRSRT